ncbi:MAG: hypothetical protein KGJ02_06950 [Verrucomicrobiota bacterium]|nr:hypothetical protein [Verrucomicrobiota bacterium]
MLNPTTLERGSAARDFGARLYPSRKLQNAIKTMNEDELRNALNIIKNLKFPNEKIEEILEAISVTAHPKEAENDELLKILLHFIHSNYPISQHPDYGRKVAKAWRVTILEHDRTRFEMMFDFVRGRHSAKFDCIQGKYYRSMIPAKAESYSLASSQWPTDHELFLADMSEFLENREKNIASDGMAATASNYIWDVQNEIEKEAAEEEDHFDPLPSPRDRV